MDEVQCEREGPMMSEEMESGVDLIYSHAGSNQVPAHQIQNRTQQVGSIQQDALNNNAEKKGEDCGERMMEEEDDEDDVIVDGEDDSSMTRGQSPDTPMTDSSSDMASLVELQPSPETTDPISPGAGSPDDQSCSDSESETHTCTKGISTSTTGPSTTGPTISTTGPTISTTGPTISTTGPTISTTGPTISTTGPSISTTGPSISTTGPSTTVPSTSGPSTTGPSTTGPTISTTVPSTTVPSTTVPSTTVPSTTVPSTTGPSTTGPFTTGPSISTTGPSTTGPSISTTGPSTTGPSISTTGPSTTGPSISTTGPSTTVPSISTTGPSTTVPSISTTGPSTTGPTISTTGPTISTTGPSISTTRASISTTGPTFTTTGPTISTTGPTFTTTGPTISTTGPTISTTGPAISTTGPSSSTTGPAISTTGPAISTTGPSTTGPSISTTEHISSPALLATLQGLAERGDHSHLPQYLHQIAEAFVLQGDYERAVWCIQLERVYHQRLVHNLTTLQEQWERRCQSNCQRERNSKSDLAARQLERLTDICRTHKRPSTGAEQCEVIASVLKSSVQVQDRPFTVPSGPLVESVPGLEEAQRRTEPAHSQGIHPVRSAGGAPMDTLCSNDTTDLGVSQDCGDLSAIRGFHRDDLIDGSVTTGEGRKPQRLALGQQAERELEHTTAEEGVTSDSPPALEMSRPKPEEQQGGVDEVEVAEEALALVGEEVEEEQKRGGGVCLKASLEEVSVLTVKEQLTAEEVQQDKEIQLHVIEGLARGEYDQEEDVFDVEMVDAVQEEGASLDDLAKHITVEEMSPVPGLVSILKRRSVCVEGACVTPSAPPKQKTPAKRKVRFKEPEDGFDQDEVGVDSCLLLFLLCLVTVVISLGGTALYCALGDAHSTVCTDFSRNADFYLAQLHHGMGQLRHWLIPGS